MDARKYNELIFCGKNRLFLSDSQSRISINICFSLKTPVFADLNITPSLPCRPEFSCQVHCRREGNKHLCMSLELSVSHSLKN